jgi:hypothetical protein
MTGQMTGFYSLSIHTSQDNFDDEGVAHLPARACDRLARMSVE